MTTLATKIGRLIIWEILGRGPFTACCAAYVGLMILALLRHFHVMNEEGQFFVTVILTSVLFAYLGPMTPPHLRPCECETDDGGDL